MPRDDMARVIYEEHVSIGQLAGELGDWCSTLIHDEIALAKREVADRLRGLKQGLAFAAAAGLLALLGLFALVLAAVAALSRSLPEWLAALLVAALVILGAALLARTAVRRLRPAALKPAVTLRTMRETKAWLFGSDQPSRGTR